MSKDRAYFLLLNVGHFLDHLISLIFASAAALALTQEWGVSYAELLAYATPGFVAFGVFALPAGWLADRWSRDGMMVVFFIGLGLAAIATSFANTPFHGMRIAANGVWGNLGVASAALVTGFMIDNGGWRFAFIFPGLVSIFFGVIYAWLRWDGIWAEHRAKDVR